MKPAATKALAVGIAKVASKPELIKRIHAEITDAFDVPDAGPDTAESRAAPDKSRKQATARRGQKPDLAMLAKRDDLTAYLKQRQGEKRR